MDYNKFYYDIIDEVVKGVNKKYPIEKLDRELKMDISINKELLQKTINDIIEHILNVLKIEQKEKFIEYCEKTNQNNVNVMLAVKYEDNNMYARSFVEYKACNEICKYLQNELDKNTKKEKKSFFAKILGKFKDDEKNL